MCTIWSHTASVKIEDLIKGKPVLCDCKAVVLSLSTWDTSGDGHVQILNLDVLIAPSDEMTSDLEKD